MRRGASLDEEFLIYRRENKKGISSSHLGFCTIPLHEQPSPGSVRALISPLVRIPPRSTLVDRDTHNVIYSGAAGSPNKFL